jgi:hypothetical protein
MANGHTSAIRILGILVAMLVSVPGDAVAHRPAEVSPTAARGIGAPVSTSTAGMIRVHLPGPDLVTHGGDPSSPTLRSPIAQGLRGARRDSAAPLWGGQRRAPVCGATHFLHLVYVGPSTPGAAKLRSIRLAMDHTNAVLNAEAQASGGNGADYRVLCDAKRRMRITQVISPESAYAPVVSALRVAGLASPATDYVVFVDRVAAACGYGSYVDDSRPGPENMNNTRTGYALVYRDCWFGSAPMHEIGHLMGAVQPDAPNSTGSGGHCADETDVMCYIDGGDRNQTVSMRCVNAMRFDCGFNDYFDAAPEPGEYLATHWNVASAANPFIRLR